jgi:hypothetical protein
MLNGFSAAEVTTGAMPRVTAKAEPTATEMIDFLLDMMVLLDVLMDTTLHLTGKSGIFIADARKANCYRNKTEFVYSL